MLRLGIASLRNRRFVAGLTVLAIALSIALILGVERLRTEARVGFANAASGIDLIIAPRGNDVQILLATVFGTGSTGSGMRWDSFQAVRALPQVDWAVPLMAGDNHRGFPVIGTSGAYFERFRHSRGQALAFSAGGPFAGPDGAVVGAGVADRFGYAPGVQIVNAHGAGSVAFDMHDEAPFTIEGVLAHTGTAVDRMVFVSLEGFDRLHQAPQAPGSDPFASAVPDAAGDGPYRPDLINAMYVGLAERSAVLSVQRAVFDYPGEALSAVMPNIALLQLWSITGTAETALRLMAGAVAVAGLIGLVVMLSATLEARRREFAILRSVGATPGRIFGLIVMEAGLLLGAGVVLGYALLTLAVLLADPILAGRFGLRMGAGLPTGNEVFLIGLVFFSGLLASILPATRVYRMTLADGLSVRA